MNIEPNIVSAFAAFDAYNEKDPNREVADGKEFSKEVLYARRMSEWLERLHPSAPEHIKLAVRCQHIGRWEIPRNDFPMDKKGYLQWRSKLKMHHARLAEGILRTVGYQDDVIEKVKFLLQKRQLGTHPETQLLEDVVCLVFIQYYLEDFASKHPDDKVVDIIQKTLKKMSKEATTVAATIPVSERVTGLLSRSLAD